MVVVVSCCSGNVSGMPSSSSGHCELGEMVVVNTVAAIVTDIGVEVVGGGWHDLASAYLSLNDRASSIMRHCRRRY